MLKTDPNAAAVHFFPFPRSMSPCCPSGIQTGCGAEHRAGIHTRSGHAVREFAYCNEPDSGQFANHPTCICSRVKLGMVRD